METKLLLTAYSNSSSPYPTAQSSPNPCDLPFSYNAARVA